MIVNKIHIVFFTAVLSMVLLGCKPEEKIKEGVYLSLQEDPQNMNPINSTSAYSSDVQAYLLSKLLTADRFTYDLQPMIAKSLPEVVAIKGGGEQQHWEIKEDAAWDDGTPITGADFIFSLKALRCPGVDGSVRLKPYYDFVSAIKVDASNPKKFTVTTDRPYFRNLTQIGFLDLLPKHIYDEAGHLNDISLSEIADLPKTDKRTSAFAKIFNGPKFQNTCYGAGAYKLEKKVPNQRVVLRKKANWWGDNYKDSGIESFQVNQDKLVLEIIKDANTEVVALKGSKIDAIGKMKPEAYVKQFRDDASQEELFYLRENPDFMYIYLTFNRQNPKFEDKRVRRAFAHMIDIDKFIEQVMYNMGTRVHTIVSPIKGEFISPKLKKFDYSLEKASTLLDQAGWKDTDGDGVRDKVVNGKKTPFEFEAMVSSNKESRQRILLTLKENASKIGVRVNVTPIDFNVLSDKAKKGEYEMFCLGWGLSPLEGDPTQLWKSDAQANFGGFGNAQSDKLIEDLIADLDQGSRIKKWHKLEEMIQEDMPYVFLLSPSNGVAVNKRFQEFEFSKYGEGFNPQAFITKAVIE